MWIATDPSGQQKQIVVCNARQKSGNGAQAMAFERGLGPEATASKVRFDATTTVATFHGPKTFAFADRSAVERGRKRS